MQAILSFPVQYVSTGLHRLWSCGGGLLSLLGLKAPVTLVVWESLKVTQYGPELSAVTKAYMYEAPSR